MASVVSFPATARPRTFGGRRRRPAREARLAMMLSAPALVLLLLFIILPTIAVLFLGFTDFELGYGSFNFVGFENYAELLNDRTFRKSLWNTAVYAAIVAPVSMALGLAIALLIEAEGWGKSLFPDRLLPASRLVARRHGHRLAVSLPIQPSGRSMPRLRLSASRGRTGSGPQAR